MCVPFRPGPGQQSPSGTPPHTCSHTHPQLCLQERLAELDREAAAQAAAYDEEEERMAGWGRWARVLRVAQQARKRTSMEKQQETAALMDKDRRWCRTAETTKTSVCTGPPLTALRLELRRRALALEVARWARYEEETQRHGRRQVGRPQPGVMSRAGRCACAVCGQLAVRRGKCACVDSSVPRLAAAGGGAVAAGSPAAAPAGGHAAPGWRAGGRGGGAGVRAGAPSVVSWSRPCCCPITSYCPLLPFLQHSQT